MRRTLENQLSFLEATVRRFVDLASAFQSTNRIMAPDRMSPTLLKFIKAYYPSTNDEGWGNWGEDSMV